MRHRHASLLSFVPVALIALTGCQQPEQGGTKIAASASNTPHAESRAQPPSDERARNRHDESPPSAQQHPAVEGSKTAESTDRTHSVAKTPQDNRAAPPRTKPPPAWPVLPEWVYLGDIFKSTAPVICVAKWTGGNRMEIKSDNVHRLTLDLRRLPDGAPTRGPWNLQIDGQGIDITGRRGKKIELVRSQNGDWSVDIDRMPQPR